MLTLLHLSDIHFGPAYVPKVGESLLKTAGELNPDLVVASGDFTQRAKEHEFAQAREFLDRLPPAPLVVTPGNHDVPVYRVAERLRDPFANYRKYISEKLDDVLHHEKAVVVSMNSTAPYRAITNGRISRWQLNLCADAFADAPDGVARIVVAHHHFAPAPDYEGGDVMPKAKRAIDLFTSLRIDLILGGHLHRAYIGNSLDVYPGKDREHGIIIVQSGTSASRRGRAREREKNSFNFIRIDDETIRVTHFMYFDDADGFAPISRHLFPRGHRAYLEGDAGMLGQAASREA